MHLKFPVKQLTRLIEAALFSADGPLKVSELARLDREATREEIKASLAELKEHYEAPQRGVELLEVGEGYQLLTLSEFAAAIVNAQIVTRPRKLSTAAMETLAIIAYKQPVERSEVEEIRGVVSEGVLRSLQERGLIELVGRGEGLGRPLQYGTTQAFLELLGLKDAKELPRLEELSVALSVPVEFLQR